MWSVITTTAVSLNHGIIDIQTAGQAASALQPLVNTFPYAGVMAKSIFSVAYYTLSNMANVILLFVDKRDLPVWKT